MFSSLRSLLEMVAKSLPSALANSAAVENRSAGVRARASASRRVTNIWPASPHRAGRTWRRSSTPMIRFRDSRSASTERGSSSVGRHRRRRPRSSLSHLEMAPHTRFASSPARVSRRWGMRRRRRQRAKEPCSRCSSKNRCRRGDCRNGPLWRMRSSCARIAFWSDSLQQLGEITVTFQLQTCRESASPANISGVQFHTVSY